MTVQSTENKAGPYTGDNATRDWILTFPVNGVTDTEIIGYLADSDGISVEITSDYEVDRNALTYTYPTLASGLVPLTPSQTLTILRTLSLTQDTDLRNQGSLPAEVIEQEFDRLTMISQQLKEQIDRSPQTDVSGSGEDTDLQAALIATQNARDDAQDAATAAAADAAIAVAAILDVQTAATAAATAKTNAETAETNAEAAQAAAEAARDQVEDNLMAPYAAGDILVGSNDTERNFTGSTAYRPSKSIYVVRTGTLRISFDLAWVSGASLAQYARLARDRAGVITFVGIEQSVAGGSGYVTKTEDIAGWEAADKVVLYVANLQGGEGKIRNLRLYADIPTIETLVLDTALT